MRRVLAATTAGLLMLGALAACSSSGSGSISHGKVKVEKGNGKITVQDGNSSISVGDAKLPKSFPTDNVPLPDGGALKAVVAGKDGGASYYSLTYAFAGKDLKTVASGYKRALQDHGFVIKQSAAVGGSAGSFAAYTAVGKNWDVVAYSGGSEGTDGAMSLQVTKHDPTKNVAPGS
jgi:hypothetical protein